jgi:hypothetical protein
MGVISLYFSLEMLLILVRTFQKTRLHNFKKSPKMTNNVCVLFSETVNTSIPFSFEGILFPKVLFKKYFVLS